MTYPSIWFSKPILDFVDLWEKFIGAYYNNKWTLCTTFVRKDKGFRQTDFPICLSLSECEFPLAFFLRQKDFALLLGIIQSRPSKMNIHAKPNFAMQYIYMG